MRSYQDTILYRTAEGFEGEQVEQTARESEGVIYNCSQCQGWVYDICNKCPGLTKRIGRVA